MPFPEDYVAHCTYVAKSRKKCERYKRGDFVEIYDNIEFG